MGKIVELPRKTTNDFKSLITLLQCPACHTEWFGCYEDKLRIEDLHCPYCDHTKVATIQGEREVYFYQYPSEE